MWQDYEYQGRLRVSDADSGLGLSVYGRYPAGEAKAYLLQRYSGSAATEQFHLATLGTGTTLQGDVELGVTPQADQWYRFRVQVTNQVGRVTLRAKVWAEGSSEPGQWQAAADDTGAGRLTTGAVGLWASDAGRKAVDDLTVVPLDVLEADFYATEQSGEVPFSPTFISTSLGQVVTYTWRFGDGSVPLVGSLSTVSHTYTQTGSYTVSLFVENGTASDSLTQTNYITVTEPAPLAADFWATPMRQGPAPLSLWFNDASSGNPTGYFWSFGDGVTSTLINPSHTYTVPNVYTVTLTVSDGIDADSMTKTNYITVTTPASTTLRGYWTLDEASGQRQDSSTYGNHLTETSTTGSVGALPGRIDQAADLEADQNAYLLIDDTLQDGLTITDSLTLVGWLKPESLGGWQTLAAKYQYGGGQTNGGSVWICARTTRSVLSPPRMGPLTPDIGWRSRLRSR